MIKALFFRVIGRLEPSLDEGLDGVFSLDHDQGRFAVPGELLGERTHDLLSKEGVTGGSYDYQVVMTGLLSKGPETVSGNHIFGFK